MQHQSQFTSRTQRERSFGEGLPALPLSLIGREREVETACRLLQLPSIRLLTLTGSGGVGKTCLAIQVAKNLLDEFVDGISFIPLTSIKETCMVIPTISHMLEIQECADQTILSTLKAFLHNRHYLLILDNFEHVIAATPLIADLLEACPTLKILVTSREPLRIRAEQQLVVPPLALPNLKHPSKSESVLQSPAVSLFVQRVQAIKPGFQVNESNAHAIAKICHCLDGLPLALELAAARLKVLSPPALLTRLKQGLGVLASRSHDLPERQQTLRNTIQWSYNLLNPQEQRLFRRLSVFVGGCSLEAIEALYSARNEEVEGLLDEITSLIDKNLVQRIEQNDGELRFTMLELIREYAQECMEATEDTKAIYLAHATYYTHFLEALAPKINRTEQLQCMEAVEQDYENIRASLTWLVENDQMENAFRICAVMWKFWLNRSYMHEGSYWLQKVITHCQERNLSVSARARADVHYGVATMAYFQHNHDYAVIEAEFNLCLKWYQEAGYRSGVISTLSALGHLALFKGDYKAAQARYEESLPIVTEVEDRWHLVETTTLAGRIAMAQGNAIEAQTKYEEAVKILRELGERQALVHVLGFLGQAVSMTKDESALLPICIEKLTVALELKGPPLIITCLEEIGELLARQERWAEAALVWGAVEVLRETIKEPITCVKHIEHMTNIRAHLEEASISEAWQRGRTLTPEQVLAWLKDLPAAPTIPTRQSETPPLSTKERNNTKIANKNRRVPNDILRRERKRLNLTQEQLAEELETDPVNISRWERGEIIPGPRYRKKLCERFSLSLEVLFPTLLDEPKQEEEEEEEQPVSFPQPVPSANHDKSLHIQANPAQQEVRQPDEIPYTSTFHFNVRLTDYREFYGRKYEWNTLQNRLLKQSSTSIIGPRRIGKTWLMTYLKLVAPQKLGPHIRIGHLDATMPTCNTLSGFIAEIFKALEILPSPSPPAPLDIIMLETAIRNMIAQNETPVLCIDEFEALCRCPDFHLNFLENLRALTQIGLALVIASKRPLIDIVAEAAGELSKTSPFFNVFEQITLKPFIEREAQQFVQAKGSQAGFTEQEQALMLHYGQLGQSQWPPLRLQLVGDLLERDKMLALNGDPERYRPEEPSYWNEFEQRLEEKYWGVVS